MLILRPLLGRKVNWSAVSEGQLVACHRLLHRLGFEPGPREMSDGQGVEEES